jgi:serine/threonine-protein kinase
VGTSLIRAALSDRVGGREPRPLPADAPPVPGYNLLRVLGDGGFSVVYLARHSVTGELRALKVGPIDDPGRFQREVRLLKALSGSHVVRYHEHGQLPGQFWIAMEYLGEFTLADLLRSRPTAEQALLLAEQVLRGLECLHTAGIIHRDLKPENAMVGEDFRLRLIDFGLAKPLPGTLLARTVSQTGGLIGTPRYMSPEQIRNPKDLTPAADLWAFGVMLYEMLTGRPLFESDNIMALGHEILTKEVRVSHPRVPVEIRDFLQSCLERDLARRWPDAVEALSVFVPLVDEFHRRLRHERYRVSWGAVLEKGLLTRFAASHKGQLPPDAVAQFVTLARQEGIAAVDEERLEQILGPIFACQEQVVQAERDVVQAKQQLQQEAPGLSGVALVRREEQITELEKIQKARERQVREKIQGLLAENLQNWYVKQRLAEAAQSRRQEEEARRRQGAEAPLELSVAGLDRWLHQPREQRVLARLIAGSCIVGIALVALGILFSEGGLGWLANWPGIAGTGLLCLGGLLLLSRLALSLLRALSEFFWRSHRPDNGD